MDHGHVREPRVGIEPRDDRVEIRRHHPVVLHGVVVDPVARRDLLDALAVDAVVDDQQPAVLRHQGRDHALDRGRAGAGDQHDGPGVRIEPVDVEEAPARLVLQVEELALAMAEIGLREATTHSLGQGHGPGIEQQHHGARRAARWSTSRSFTSTGVTVGRGRSAGVPTAVDSPRKRGPSTTSPSNSASIDASSPLSFANA